MSLYTKHLPITDSTMLEAKRVLHEISTDAFGIVTADMQTTGRGRRGSVWESSKGAFLGTCILPKADTDLLVGFSLACGVFIASLLKDSVVLKWPNDIFLNNKKCGGILVESAERVFVGIGLNFQSAPEGFSALIDTQREYFYDQLCKNIATFYAKFLSCGFKHFREGFSSRDYLLGKKIIIEGQYGNSAETGNSGIACGVSENGSLCLQTDSEIIDVVSGHVIIM